MKLYSNLEETPEVEPEIEAVDISKKRETRKQRAKKKRIKKVALTALLVASIAATGAFVVPPVIENAKETSRVESLIAAYYENGVITLPETITSKRSYDITFANGTKLREVLTKKANNIICINGIYYTPNGTNLALLKYNVMYVDYIDANKINVDGTTIYTAPQGYILHGTKAYKVTYAEETRIVPEANDYSAVTIEGAYQYQMSAEPQIISSLPYNALDNQTLICDVPDGTSLDQNNECVAALKLAPKKH